jgi:ABC-type Mn2+/Zn2+ transport system ATPase subunit
VVRYERVTALTGVTFSLAPGEALGIVGPNGSGKSTLLKAIAGLLEPAAGTVSVFGRSPRDLEPGAIGYVPQIEAVDWTFPVSVGDVVAMGRYPRVSSISRFSKRDRAIVADALAALNLEDLRDRHISQLSGGQQQRVFVARALAQEPRLLLLDEPTTGVDAATTDALREVIRGRVGAGLPVLMTTHDLDDAAKWFDFLMVVDHRVLAFGDPSAVLESGAYAGIREHTHTHGHARSEPPAGAIW